MNLKALYPITLILALATGNAYAECQSPAAPQKIPRGKSAGLEQMAASQKAVKDFDTATNDYVSCLQLESDAEIAKLEQSETDPKKKEERKKRLVRDVVKKQNAAIDADKALAARFNEQLRAFKAKDAQ